MEKENKKNSRMKNILIAIGVLIVLGSCSALLGDSEETENNENKISEEDKVEMEKQQKEFDKAQEKAEEESKSDENVDEQECVEKEEKSVLSDNDVENLENGLTQMLSEKYKDVTVHSFKYEDNRITTMIDVQQDPLPSKEEAGDIIADASWYTAQLNEEVDTTNFYVTSMLVTETGPDEFIHWMSDKWDPLSEEYTFEEKEAASMLN